MLCDSLLRGLEGGAVMCKRCGFEHKSHADMDKDEFNKAVAQMLKEKHEEEAEARRID